jgi:probable HAF family extracellular repeat protein
LPAYNYTTIDSSGTRYIEARGINNAGQIVGWYTDGNDFHGFVYGSGTYTNIDVTNTGPTQAYGINDAGQIVAGCPGFC